MKAEFRNISPSIGSSFKATLFEEKEFEAMWHLHPQYEITYMLKSEGTRYVGDSIHFFEENDLVMIGPNLPHCWKSDEVQKQNVKCIIIQWDEVLLNTWLEKEEFNHIKKMMRASLKGLHFGVKTARSIEKKLLNLIKAEPFDRLILFLKILQELSISNDFKTLAGSGFSENFSKKENKRVSAIYNFVRENYTTQIKLDDIAQEVSMSKEAFCRFFKKTFAMSSFEFINKYKINMACKHLIDSDLSVSEIAYKVGYNNVSFFHRQFVKFINETPVKYRKYYRNIPSS